LYRATLDENQGKAINKTQEVLTKLMAEHKIDFMNRANALQ
jgi:hypothetical protein